MWKIMLPVALLATALASTLCVLPALAQTRVFVAAQGSDGNACTFASPCRTFQHAHDVVAANGEIDVLDPAGYGALTITKSISIQGHGFSGISVPSGATGVTINAGATDKINLNGLILDGAGVGASGIGLLQAGSLEIANCVVRNNVFSGIALGPTTAIRVKIKVSDTVADDNGGHGIDPTESNRECECNVHQGASL